jgi:hypothetical protein
LGENPLSKKHKVQIQNESDLDLLFKTIAALRPGPGRAVILVVHSKAGRMIIVFVYLRLFMPLLAIRVLSILFKCNRRQILDDPILVSFLVIMIPVQYSIDEVRALG